ncbi:Response regulator receiver domain-containing protein [Loktanella fryxellensis]|uniref:Response regulator receiver domain-containing protein n=1 Tax=Loktanella fryxellensis TaxID=245187 RepID=A0A1H8ESK7_9RHOB|nr:response regulator [Loktanella fryxellensis]SEN22475.1 Response regulator receiver domain-containing protein [Loktanella fryxellensis]
MDNLSSLLTTRAPTAQRPLLGLTVLVVEDSRFACEAMRMLCLRSGARIRRADTLASARKHLSVYRPTVVIVDVGLPDGSGTALIRALSQGLPRIDVILGTSGDLTAEDAVIAAGADGFVAKPMASLAAFQAAILMHLPPDRQPPGPRMVSRDRVEPDLLAYRDDLSHAADVLDHDDSPQTLDYVTQFLSGVATSAKDADMQDAVCRVIAQRAAGVAPTTGLRDLGRMVRTRLSAAPGL